MKIIIGLVMAPVFGPAMMLIGLAIAIFGGAP